MLQYVHTTIATPDTRVASTLIVDDDDGEDDDSRINSKGFGEELLEDLCPYSRCAANASATPIAEEKRTAGLEQYLAT